MIDNKVAFGMLAGIAGVLVAVLLFSNQAVSDDIYIISGGGNSSGGVTSLTSNNSAIELSGSTGAISLNPKWQLLAQNITIAGSASGSTTIVNQNLGSVSALNCGTTATTICAEKLTASSVLVGQSFNKITVGLKKVNTPTGTATIGVFDASGNTLFTCGTTDISALTTSYQAMAFTCPSVYTLSASEYVGVKSPVQSGANQLQISATTPNQFDTTNSIVSQFTSGSWADASTWDLGSNTASGAWILEQVGITFLDVDFTTKKHLLVTAELRTNATSNFLIRLNNDTGTNYALSTTISGTTSALTSKTSCDILNAGNTNSGDRMFLVMWIDNNQSGDRKVAIGDFASGMDSTSSTAPSNVDFSCKWSNTANQVNNVVMIGRFTTGSIVTVWGYD